MAWSSWQQSSKEDHCSLDEGGWWIEVEGKGFAKQDQWNKDEGKMYMDFIGCLFGLYLLLIVFVM